MEGILLWGKKKKKREYFFPLIVYKTIYFFLKKESILPALFLVVLIHPNVSSSHMENISICFKKTLVLIMEL